MTTDTLNPPRDPLGLLVTAEWLAFADRLTEDNLEHVVLETARQAALAGFAGLELPIPHAAHLFDVHGEAFWARMADALEIIGCPIRTVHGPTFAPLDTPMDEAISALEATARIASACRAQVVVVHPTPHSHSHVTNIAARLLERDTDLCHAVAEQLTGPTRLAVENLPTYGVAHLTRIMQQVRHPRVGVCFDTGHWNVRPEGSIEQVLHALGERIIHWHLSDNDGWTDQHRVPGEGVFPWGYWARCLTPEQWQLPVLVELSVPLMQQDPEAPQRASDLWCRAFHQSAQTLQPLVPQGIHPMVTRF